MNYRPLDTPAVLALPLTGVQLIEASAGTGKTYTIANLYLRHLLAGRAVGDLLVVTFTKAATDELRGRIRARLADTLTCLEQGQTPEDDGFLQAQLRQLREQDQTALAIRRLRFAVRAMDEAAIFTIHGFCQRALTDFAFNSGQPIQMEVLTDDQELRHQAVEDWWRRNGYPLPSVHLELFADNLGGPNALRTQLAPLLGPEERRLLPDAAPLQEVFARFDQALRPALEPLAERWRNTPARWRKILEESRGLSRAQKSPYCPATLTAHLACLDAYWARDPLPAPPSAFAVLTPQTMGSSPGRAADPALHDPLFHECGQVWQAYQRFQRDLRVAAWADAARFVRTQVREAKQQVQALSFDDLLTEMQRALAGPNGESLAEGLRRRFPVAMIDEFQDTDAVQYAIFRRLYRGRPDLGLVLIGDPKQAIYSFRGGDIFTYLRAKQDVGEGHLYTLTTNWRSTPEVLTAVNALFQRRSYDAFVYGDPIPFLKTEPAQKAHHWLCDDGQRHPALTLWTLPSQASGRPLSKEDAEHACHQAVAQEIARLIAGGRDGRITLGKESLKPKDIAVLVPTAWYAAELRQALAARGIPAVSVGRDSVFQSDEAAALEVLLQAVQNPRDRSLARLALASPLLGHPYGEVERIVQGEDEWMQWVDGLLELHHAWQRRGFMTLFQQLLRTLGIAPALSRAPEAERRLTNLLHLAELLQQASKTHAGMDALLAWYRVQRAGTTNEEAILRLESDAALVHILTVHASKGLEYPVVFVPYLWQCKVRDSKGLLSFYHDGEACLDAGSDAINTHLCLAEQERLAEDVRLVYVALTRAAAALYVTWGCVGTKPGKASETALGYLLHPRQAGARLRDEKPDAFAGLKDLQPDLQALAQAAQGNIRITPLPEDDQRPPLAPLDQTASVTARVFNGQFHRNWRISSFSELTQGLPVGPSLARGPAGEAAAPRLPAGPHVGSYLHLLLEQLDFQGDIDAQVLAHSARIAPRFGLEHARWGQEAASLLRRAVHTPLDASGLSLAHISRAQRLCELSFDFATDTVDIAALQRALEQAAGRRLPALGGERFRGMVTGIIDLVFAQGDRYYLVDYKSSDLGPEPAAYAPERLREVVDLHRYDLQYLLYSLALHRYLGQRQRDYRYAAHFGGVFYLFLRGMRPESDRHGVLFERPPESLIETLDRRIFACDLGGVG